MTFLQDRTLHRCINRKQKDLSTFLRILRNSKNGVNNAAIVETKIVRFLTEIENITTQIQILI